jgi:heme oxygenase (biliverdin-producing, ferredoxin)
MINSTGPGLAERLKLGTRTLHQQAERSGVMADLLHQRIDLETYGRLLHNLHAIYAALEAALERHRDDPVAGFCADLQLHRAARLRDDIAQLFPGARREPSSLVPATHAYVARLHALATEEPARLVAHAYVRYLGDLHGGQSLARIVRRCFVIGDERGTAFYDFGDEARVQQRRAAFRQALAALPVTQAQDDAIVAEAIDAFARHIRLFEELASR